MMTLMTEYAVTRGKSMIVHDRFPHSLSTVCGARVLRTVVALAGRRRCTRCARYLR